MKKKVLLLTVIMGSLFLIVGCGNTKISSSDDISYTNKFECSRKEASTTQQVYYSTKQYPSNESDNGKTAVETESSRIYDFNKNGDKLLAYYDITTYNYLVDYDMNAQKAYFETTCKNIDKNTYKSCNVTLKDKVITIISEVDLNSEESKKYLSKATLDSIKENYLESSYTCK